MDEVKIKAIKAAKKAREYSYSPYSNFRVGAGLIIAGGKIYSGCNVENISYGLSVCAERVAIFKALSEGCKNFETLVVSSDGSDFVFPCGACLQVMVEFCENLEIILANNKGDYKIKGVKELMPAAFDASMFPSQK